MRDHNQPFISLELWIDHNAAALICCHDRCRCASVEGSRPTTHLRNLHGPISADRRISWWIVTAHAGASSADGCRMEVPGVDWLSLCEAHPCP